MSVQKITARFRKLNAANKLRAAQILMRKTYASALTKEDRELLKHFEERLAKINPLLLDRIKKEFENRPEHEWFIFASYGLALIERRPEVTLTDSGLEWLINDTATVPTTQEVKELEMLQGEVGRAVGIYCFGNCTTPIPPDEFIRKVYSITLPLSFIFKVLHQTIPLVAAIKQK